MIVRGQNLSKRYGKLEVLKNIQIEVEAGEIVSIVGASGAGKSTLLHILGTLDRPDTGTVEINQVDWTNLSPQKLAKFRNQSIGFVFQFHNLLPEFTALENICLPAFLAGAARPEAEKRAKEIMEVLGVVERASHLPSEMSGGEQQRVAVARALINQPQIIFGDEPSGNLDSHNSDELHKLFLKLKTEFKQTFIIVTHNQALAEMCDRVLLMKDGDLSMI